MNLFFFIYQELEFQNYFPIALEIKNKYKESNITYGKGYINKSI